MLGQRTVLNARLAVNFAQAEQMFRARLKIRQAFHRLFAHVYVQLGIGHQRREQRNDFLVVAVPQRARDGRRLFGVLAGEQRGHGFFPIARQHHSHCLHPGGGIGMHRRHRQQIRFAVWHLEFFNQRHRARLASHRIEHLVEPLLERGIGIHQSRIQPPQRLNQRVHLRQRQRLGGKHIADQKQNGDELFHAGIVMERRWNERHGFAQIKNPSVKIRAIRVKNMRYKPNAIRAKASSRSLPLGMKSRARR